SRLPLGAGGADTPAGGTRITDADARAANRPRREKPCFVSFCYCFISPRSFPSYRRPKAAAGWIPTGWPPPRQAIRAPAGIPTGGPPRCRAIGAADWIRMVDPRRVRGVLPPPSPLSLKETVHRGLLRPKLKYPKKRPIGGG